MPHNDQPEGIEPQRAVAVAASSMRGRVREPFPYSRTSLQLRNGTGRLVGGNLQISAKHENGAPAEHGRWEVRGGKYKEEGPRAGQGSGRRPTGASSFKQRCTAPPPLQLPQYTPFLGRLCQWRGSNLPNPLRFARETFAPSILGGFVPHHPPRANFAKEGSAGGLVVLR